MSMVTSFNLLSRPAPLKKISSTPMQARKLAAAPPAVAFPSLRRKLFVCHAYTYDVPPFALVHPKFPEFSPRNNNWKIEEEADHINLWFKVGEETNTKDLAVEIKGNLLLIRYNGKKDDDTASPPVSHPASKLDVRLLLPSGYEDDDPEKKVKAELTLGSMLMVTVTKPNLKPNVITIGPSGQSQA